MNIIEMPKLKYGIYSIKQRADSERSTCRRHCDALSNSDGDNVVVGNNTITNNVFKDRVRKISQKVDTMKLNDDSNEDNELFRRTPIQIRTSSNGQSADNKFYAIDSANNTTNTSTTNSLKTPNTISSSAKATATASAKEITSFQIDSQQVDNLDGNQTQGDKLNQIKALRRRHSRSVNVFAAM